MENGWIVAKTIEQLQPSSISQLTEVLRFLKSKQEIERYKINVVKYYGVKQGVKVIIDGVKFPLERGHVYSILN